MIVFTRSSLPRYIEFGRVNGFGDGIMPDPARDGLFAATVGEDRFVVHREDTPASELIMVAEECWSEITGSIGERPVRFLERVDRASRAMARPPVSLPLQWSKFSYENLLAFFALPKNLNTGSLRWIAESLRDGHVGFWQLTGRGHRLVALQDFPVDHEPVGRVVGALPAALAESAAAFAGCAPEPQLLQPSIDLDRVGTGSLVKSRTYSEWLPQLTDKQKDVLGWRPDEPLKIRGVAGSGKTLVLQLKALHELYRADDEGEEGAELPQILFLTHSWAMAEQVQDAFDRLDERGLASRIDVTPLTYLREWLQGEPPSGVEVLGDDSLDGKKQQMRLVGEAIDEIRRNTWETYRKNTGEWVREGVEAEPRDAARLRLGWALMREFAEVFDSHQIKPGINGLKKYRGLPREQWMVPFSGDADREFAFAVFRHYVQRLVDEGQLTTDQMVDDFRRYLETYAWNAQRPSRGYDLILVDEFHLFSDTERYLLHLLPREDWEHPRLVMAMDPSQSVFMLLTGLSEDGISRTPVNMLSSRSPEAIDLVVAHRFTAPIHDFVQYLHRAMPHVVTLGNDWSYESALPSGGRSGDGMPRAHLHPQETLVRAAVDAAFAVHRDLPPEKRVALIGVGNGDLEAIRQVLRQDGHPAASTVLIEGRDDIERLRYSRRALIVTASEYAAGLQFSHVVVVGGVGGSYEYGFGASAMRALHSQFYLAASRAEEGLDVFAPDEGSFSDVLSKGVEAGVVRQ